MPEEPHHFLDEASKRLFIESVDESLKRLGPKFEEAILRHVERRTSLTIIDVADKPGEFMQPIKDVLGAGSVRVLEDHIASRFYSKVGLAFTPTPAHTLEDYLKEAKERQKDKARGEAAI